MNNYQSSPPVNNHWLFITSRFLLPIIAPAMIIMLTGCPSPGGSTNAPAPSAYRYTTTLSGRVFDTPPDGTTVSRNGATVIIEAEGHEVGRTVSSTIDGVSGSYRITFDHPGTFRVTTSFAGRSHTFLLTSITKATIDYINIISK